MAEAVVLNIGDMIDLAIGTPEVGVVDFNMLQTVLHCLAQQLRVDSKNVEVRGSLASLPIVKQDNIQTIAITEYAVDTDNADVATVHKQPLPPAPPNDDTMLVVERVKKSDLVKPHSPKRDKSPSPASSATQPMHAAPHSGGSPKERLSLVTLSKFNVLESTVEDLKNRVYGSMPKNQEILEEVRSQTNIKAINDMWNNLNVSSRLEAAEAGISKLSSLVQDLINETAALQTAPDGNRRPTVEEVVKVASKTTEGPTLADLAKLEADIKSTRDELDKLKANVQEMQGRDDAVSSMATTERPATPATPAPEASDTPEPSEPRPRTHSVAGLDIINQRLNDLEKRLKECCEDVGKSHGTVSDQLEAFQGQLDYLTKQVGGASSKDISSGLSPDLIKDLQGLMQLFQTVQEMQEQLKNVHETALQLASEKEERQNRADALLEQIELLKTIKLDREDMVEAMAEKADVRLLTRKVSHDQFDLACDDLSKKLEQALGKLNMQESLWQQALDDIQREIEAKLDKGELSPLKDFFNNRLKQLQDHLKNMASLRRDVAAAGTKSKILKDVNCISCDAAVVMAMEAPSSIPVLKPMPANLSMKPYLSYELDSIRKTQASNIPQRNMHDWENIDKQMTQKQPQKLKPADRHLCSRYCGGSHTTTTPAQRVARVGHFVKQWGPDVLPLSSGMAAGDDGRMYRVSPTEAASVGPGGAVEPECTPKAPPKTPELSASRAGTANEDCRCLEAGRASKP